MLSETGGDDALKVSDLRVGAQATLGGKIGADINVTKLFELIDKFTDPKELRVPGPSCRVLWNYQRRRGPDEHTTPSEGGRGGTN